MLKVGDKVKVLAVPCENIEHHVQMVGKVYTVDEVYNEYNKFYCYKLVDQSIASIYTEYKGCWFNERQLELVKGE